VKQFVNNWAKSKSPRQPENRTEGSKLGDIVPKFIWRECEGVEPTYPARHEAQRI